VAERPKGMGRGLAAILSAAPKDGAEELRELPVELIEPNPRQPRTSFDDESLVALAGSIRARGVLQPVLVRPLAGGRYQLIAGERRWRAAQAAERETIPAIIRRGDDAESLELALIENMAREELSPVEEARACAALVEELGLSREEVGLRVGRSRVAVSNLIRLLELPDEALELIERGVLSEGHGRALLLAADHAERRELESRARRAQGGPRPAERRARAGSAIHPDHQAMAEQIADALQPVFGRELQVAPTRSKGFRIGFELDSIEDALELARRLRVRPAA
jgi:ParB family chromosome partitioning protein